MMLRVPRTVRRLGKEDLHTARELSRPLADFRYAKAFVLLGDPGAGKTTAFETEHEADQSSLCITARQFLRGKLENHPEWRDETLFIDGLDEVRAGATDPRPPLDRILERLQELGGPRFRLSCRAADWLGRNDEGEIASQVDGGDLEILHLDPLDEKDIREILEAWGTEDIDGFLDNATDRGIDALLRNPQSLEFLAGAVADGQWPDGRLETFRMACRKLAEEPNREHQAAQRGGRPIPIRDIAHAAGHLSALLLLSGKECVSLGRTDDPEHLLLPDIADADHAALKRALETKLFSMDSPERLAPDLFSPVHRHVGEFLGARYLAGRIEDGVPASRILALMSGEDGVVVPELRGLSAWLAAWNAEARGPLIRTDPIGVALYGDARRFSHDEKESLLKGLGAQATKLNPWNWPAVALGSLIDQETLDSLRRYVSDADRSDASQARVDLFLKGLYVTQCEASLLREFERVVRDPTWWYRVRKSALRALAGRHDHHPAVESQLRTLLEDIAEARVPDEDDELRGMLLIQLYPLCLEPPEVWDYLSPRVRTRFIGQHRLFWSSHFMENTRTEDVTRLLEELRKRGNPLLQLLDAHHLREIVFELVARAIEDRHGEADISALYNWFELLVDIDFFDSTSASDGEFAPLRSVLRDRPGLQIQLLLEGLIRCADNDDFDYRASVVRRALLRDCGTRDFAGWCLDKAVELAATHPQVARLLLEWTGTWHRPRPDDSPTPEAARLAVAGHLGLEEHLAKLMRSRTVSAEERQLEAKVAAYRRERKQQHTEFMTYVRGQRESLASGECSVPLLDFIAQAYLGVSHRDRDLSPVDRVAKLLDSDQELVGAALDGLRRIVPRPEVPGVLDIIRLDEEEQRSLYARPVLAGLAERDRIGGDALEGLADEVIVRSVASYYLTPLGLARRPGWYVQALLSHPAPVASALVQVYQSLIRRDRAVDEHVHYLAHDTRCREVSQLALPNLVGAFPVRCTDSQVFTLHAILLAAVRYLDDRKLDELIRKRTASEAMDIPQRAIWLAAGLFARPGEYTPKVVTFIEEGRDVRARHVVEFLMPHDVMLSGNTPDAPELRSLIETFGKRYVPWRPSGNAVGARASYVADERLKVEGLITRWADTLALDADVAATGALTTLAENPALREWHHVLADARDRQIVTLRRATFVIPSVEAVQATLANARPANAADLATLVADRFLQLAQRIHEGNTDDWRQYWSEGEHGRVTKPKHEDSCRDALLSDLQVLLPEGVDARREAYYAENMRSDIRAAHEGFAVPVEIKKSTHRDLWSAIERQLVPRYLRDPESGGHGIYLVLWFGPDGIPVHPSCRQPKTPRELQERLAAGIPDLYRFKVKVIVVDVSNPRKPMTRTQ